MGAASTTYDKRLLKFLGPWRGIVIYQTLLSLSRMRLRVRVYLRRVRWAPDYKACRSAFAIRQENNLEHVCEAALATYLTLSAPLLWQPVQKETVSAGQQTSRVATPLSMRVRRHVVSNVGACAWSGRTYGGRPARRPLYKQKMFPVQTARSRSPIITRGSIFGEVT